QLSNDTFEPLFAIVDDVIGAERGGLFHLVIGADRGNDRASHALGELDRRRAYARAAGMDEDGLAGLKLRIIEQHVLDRTECYGSDSRTDLVHAGRRRHEQPGRQVHLLLRETIEMEAMYAGDMLAEIVAALTAGAAEPAGARAIDRDDL